ncbi:MAG: S8 family serine peptidase [Saprospiraceae bacterium]|nr:S8 family serine peptidase [Saprospiraceae bacterium]
MRSLVLIAMLVWGGMESGKSVGGNEVLFTMDDVLRIDSGVVRVVVWFDDQLLLEGGSFLKKIQELGDVSRSALRTRVMAQLKEKSKHSFRQNEGQLRALERRGQIQDIRRHWIINGFSCSVTREGKKALLALDGISKIFDKQPLYLPRGEDMGPEFLKSRYASRFELEKIDSFPWNIEKIRAPEVWREFGITGKGTLNVVHDSGFKLDVPPLAETIYTNAGEIPGNDIDDDGNGYVDDYHGYNFDAAQANLNEPTIRRGTNIHGNLCAAIIAGTFATDSQQAIGMAPGSLWAPVMGSSNIEQAVEWAIEQGADTYSMSFSQPNLGEYRTHWRKVLEHGTLCGVLFISGAGNFAAGSRSARIPVQMRNPEDIPHAVLGVAGIGKDGTRPAFSSQGPVEWMTDHYQEGKVDKPDFTTINYEVPCVDPEGRLTNMASGNSLAGPHMAGIISLMLSANPELLPWEIRSILRQTARDIGEKGFDYQSGHGFVNAYDAVKAAIAW